MWDKTDACHHELKESIVQAFKNVDLMIIINRQNCVDHAIKMLWWLDIIVVNNRVKSLVSYRKLRGCYFIMLDSIHQRLLKIARG